jgi:hypothetical protein
MAFPQQIVSGDSLSWGFKNLSYTPDLWTLKAYFASSNETPTQIDATTDPEDPTAYIFNLSAELSENLVPALYHYSIRATAITGTDVKTIARNTLQVIPDPAKPVDRRTHAEKCLAAIEAVLEERMSDPIVSYEIDGVKATMLHHDKLLQLQVYYKNLIKRQSGKAVIKSHGTVMKPLIGYIPAQSSWPY